MASPITTAAATTMTAATTAPTVSHRRTRRGAMSVPPRPRPQNIKTFLDKVGPIKGTLPYDR